MNKEEVHELIDRWFMTKKVKNHERFKARLSPNEQEIRISVTM